MTCAGCNRMEHGELVTLEVSGQQVCTYCPAWKEECAARHVLENYPNREARLEMLEGLAKKQGAAAAQKLKNEVMALWHYRQRVKRRVTGA